MAFTKPTHAELKEYANKIGFTDFDPQEFLDHYEANGWYVGKVKMKDWQATVRNWKRRHAEFRRDRQQRAAPRIPYKVRQDRINALNRRKAQLIRMPQTKQVQMELEQIRIQLHKL